MAEPAHGVDSVIAAHLLRGLQSAAEGRAFGPAEQAAAEILIELDAGHTRGLAVGHAGNRARDRWRDAAGAAARATGERW